MEEEQEEEQGWADERESVGDINVATIYTTPSPYTVCADGVYYSIVYLFVAEDIVYSSKVPKFIIFIC